MDETKRQAADDFSRARTKEIFTRIMHFMDTRRNRLLSLRDVREILKPRGESYRGMETVPIKLIVGSEGRYQDFNKYFLPRSDHLRSRWERVDQARLKDITLPPIQLYEIGGVYFVRDGNHRVSVAKAQGIEMIDAEVTSLSTEIRLAPEMTIDELKKALLLYEKNLFYEKTGFGNITGCGDLDFSMPGLYDVIYNHIEVHKYYLNMNRSGEVSFDEAAASWYGKVYAPIVEIITAEKLCSLFPGRTPSDLYVWAVKHWDKLKKKYGIHYSLSGAVRDFGLRYGSQKRRGFGLIKYILSCIFSGRKP
ncbi:MAG: transcriptional regulator [Treponema sp.]|nr:transcriptional regulator [Treponema sp.]